MREDDTLLRRQSLIFRLGDETLHRLRGAGEPDAEARGHRHYRSTLLGSKGACYFRHGQPAVDAAQRGADRADSKEAFCGGSLKVAAV